MFFFFDGDENVFDNIKHVNEYGQEFWYARELQPVLEYSQWRYLKEAIERAKTACNNSGQNVADHFAEVRKMVDIGSNAKRSVEDYELSRYACYLIVMNGDPRKEIIALGQTYFAVKTRQQELIEDYERLSEEQKRIKNQDILDYMGSTELAANLFRATQTEEKLRRENIQGKSEANKTHFEVGKKVRQTIKELGGTMPEDLPTPKKSVRQIEKEHEKKMIGGEK